MLILKQLRRKKNLSQTDLAKAIGVSLRTIQLYEKKNANIPIKNLTKIADYFDLSIAEMYTYEVNEESSTYLKTIKLTKDGNRAYQIEPGKYSLMAPLISQDQYKYYISGWAEPGFLHQLPKVGFILNHVDDTQYVAFEVLGDSMDDGSIAAIPNKAIVLGREVSLEQPDTDLNGSKIMVCKDRILVKAIANSEKETDYLLCQNLNDSPEYTDFQLPKKEILQIFEIVRKQL